MKKWYEALFENYGKKYDAEVFAQGTSGECDFFEKELGYNKALKIIDIGCGTGRHSIELAKRGYTVTGVDLSESMLRRAREKAAELNLAVDFRQHDARALPFEREFDAGIMICEGGFSLMETDEMNFAILENATKAIKGGGKFIFTTLNALFPLFHSTEKFYAEQAKEGMSQCKDTSFDLMTFRDHNMTIFEDDLNRRRELKTNERFYAPSEITWLLKSLGYESIGIFGSKLGAFSRSDALTKEDFEMLVVAQKKRS